MTIPNETMSIPNGEYVCDVDWDIKNELDDVTRASMGPCERISMMTAVIFVSFWKSEKSRVEWVFSYTNKKKKIKIINAHQHIHVMNS